MATEWTIGTLKELFDRTIADRDVRVELAMSAAKEAVAKAETANNARLNLLNEFRAQASDESRKYAQAALVEQKFAAESDRVSRCENLLAQLQGALARAGWNRCCVWRHCRRADRKAYDLTKEATVIEAVIMLLIQILVLAIAAYLVIWVLGLIGVTLPPKVIQLIWAIVVLIVILLLLRILLPGLGGGRLFGMLASPFFA